MDKREETRARWDLPAGAEDLSPCQPFRGPYPHGWRLYTGEWLRWWAGEQDHTNLAGRGGWRPARTHARTAPDSESHWNYILSGAQLCQERWFIFIYFLSDLRMETDTSTSIESLPVRNLTEIRDTVIVIVSVFRREIVFPGLKRFHVLHTSQNIIQWQ